ncbi:MAG: hypothetical protein RL743_1281 [Actinomycetota bacterium]|jgi:hypothetical protein
MFDSLFSDPPRVLTKFKARKRTLSRLKYASRENHYIQVPLSRYSFKTQCALTAIGGGLGGLAIVVPILLFVDERQPEVAKDASRECLRDTASFGIPIFMAIVSIAVVNLLILTDI